MNEEFIEELFIPEVALNEDGDETFTDANGVEVTVDEDYFDDWANCEGDPVEEYEEVPFAGFTAEEAVEVGIEITEEDQEAINAETEEVGGEE